MRHFITLPWLLLASAAITPKRGRMCSLTPHVLRGTPRLSRAQEQSHRIAVRGRGLLLGSVERESWRLRPWQHPASLRPHALTDLGPAPSAAAEQHPCSHSCLSRPPSIIYLAPTISHKPTRQQLHSTRSCAVCLPACLSALLPAPANLACLHPACISIPHQHPPTTTLTPARTPARLHACLSVPDLI